MAVHETFLEPTHLPSLHEALRSLELVPAADAAVWFHPTDDAPGAPIDFTVVDPMSEGRVSVRREGPTPGGFKVARAVRLTVEATGASDAEALMTRILSAFREARRLECAGAEHFLGNPEDFSWTTEAFPTLLLPALHTAIGRELEGWTCVKVARPAKSQSVQKRVLRDATGNEVSVYSNARFFYRRDDKWLVLEVQATDPHTVLLNLSAVGVESDWATRLVGRLREVVGRQAFGNRRMTAAGEELELEREHDWDDLFVDAATKDALKDETIGFFERRHVYEKMEIPFRRGVLLHGAPGTGKTLVGRILASRVDALFIWVTAAMATSSAGIQQIFTLSRHAPRTVLFFEDLDLYGGRRSRYGTDDVLGELLVQLDGMRSNDGLLVVATTNDLEAIEPALKDRPSRFDRLIEMGVGEDDVRRAHLVRLLGAFELGDATLDAMVPRTVGFTGAQLQELAVRARMNAAQRGGSTVTAADLDAARDAAAKYRAAPIGF